MYSSFADNEECLVFYGIGQVYPSKLKAAKPSCHLRITKGVEHFAKLVDSLFLVGIAFHGTETVELFIVVVFYLFAYGGKQTVALAGLVLTATFFHDLTCFGDLAYLPALQHPLQTPAAEISGCGGNKAQCDNPYDYIPHQPAISVIPNPALRRSSQKAG